MSTSKKVKKGKSLKRLKELLWQECRRITILRYGSNCFTCGKFCEGSGRHVGHFLPSSTCGAYLRYDLRNLRIQCYNCNINQGGAGADYYRKLVETEGQKYVDQLFKDKHISIKADVWWYQEMIDKYKEITY